MYCCLAAAFLRASFLSGRGYDYSTQGLWNSLSVGRELRALAAAYDSLEEFRKEESRLLPAHIDYEAITGLRLEARQKLSDIRPVSIGQAGRISGVSPADIAVLLIYLEQNK